MRSRLVILKERHEELLRETGGPDAAEWRAIETRVNAVQCTPIERVSPAEMDSLITALDDWKRRSAR